MEKILYVVIPCYNEEEVLPITSKKIKEKIDSLIKNRIVHKESKVMFIDDGSKDNTWEFIENLCKKNSLYKGIKLTKNKGHQNTQT